MSTACCDWMQIRLDWYCDVHTDPFDCADAVLIRLRDGRYGLPVRDGGSSFITISFCPGCGTDLRPAGAT